MAFEKDLPITRFRLTTDPLILECLAPLESVRRRLLLDLLSICNVAGSVDDA